MNQTVRSALLQAAAETLEQLGFIFPDLEPTPEQLEAAPEAACRVRFRGPVSGALEIVVFGPVLSEIAANMLGLRRAAGRRGGRATRSRRSPTSSAATCCRRCRGRAPCSICRRRNPCRRSTSRAVDPECVMAQAVLGTGEGRMELLLRRYA